MKNWRKLIFQANKVKSHLSPALPLNILVDIRDRLKLEGLCNDNDALLTAFSRLPNLFLSLGIDLAAIGYPIMLKQIFAVIPATQLNLCENTKKATRHIDLEPPLALAIRYANEEHPAALNMIIEAIHENGLIIHPSPEICLQLLKLLSEITYEGNTKYLKYFVSHHQAEISFDDLIKSDDVLIETLEVASFVGALGYPKYLQAMFNQVSKETIIEAIKKSEQRAQNTVGPAHFMGLCYHHPLIDENLKSTIKLYITESIDKDSSLLDRITPLHSAIYADRTDLLKKTSIYDPEIKKRFRIFTPLMLAVLLQRREVVRELLALGACPNVTCVSPMNTFSNALTLAIDSERADIVYELIKGKADLKMNFHGTTILHYAINVSRKFKEIGHGPLTRIILDLVKNGADVNAQTKKGDTPLHLVLRDPMFSVSPLNKAVFKCLLAQKPDLDKTNIFQMNLREMLKDEEHPFRKMIRECIEEMHQDYQKVLVASTSLCKVLPLDIVSQIMTNENVAPPYVSALEVHRTITKLKDIQTFKQKNGTLNGYKTENLAPTTQTSNDPTGTVIANPHATRPKS